MSVVRAPLLSNSASFAASATSQDNFKDICKAIDVIATTRAKFFGCGHCARALARPTSMEDADSEKRLSYLRELHGNLQTLERAQAILNSKDPEAELRDDAVKWMNQVARQEKVLLKRMTKTVTATRDLYEAGQAFVASGFRNIEAFDAAMHMHASEKAAYFKEVTDFIAKCWVEFERARKEQIEQATQAGQLIDQTLARLEKIGKHVRLVSLNASVEASRVGDAGRGLGVIATEFKSLAEEIQGLAANARSNIDDLVK